MRKTPQALSQATPAPLITVVAFVRIASGSGRALFGPDQFH